MAPEQLEGKEADHRTDIFAFGAVVYEMATGQRAFCGDSQASLIGAILKDQPVAVSTLEPMCPPALDRLVMTCLAKDPEERWQSAGDLSRELAWTREQPAQTGTDAAPPRSPARLPWAVAMIAAAAALVALLLPEQTVVPPPSAFVVSLEAEMSRIGQSGFASMPLPSPDGRSLVFRGNGPEDETMLWIRSLESV